MRHGAHRQLASSNSGSDCSYTCKFKIAKILCQSKHRREHQHIKRCASYNSCSSQGVDYSHNIDEELSLYKFYGADSRLLAWVPIE